MTPLMLYWAACIALCAAVITGTVLRRGWLRRQQQHAMTARILPMDRSAEPGVHRPWSSFTGRGAPANGERRRGADRRRSDRRESPQPRG
jgi:hypothetical protein